LAEINPQIRVSTYILSLCAPLAAHLIKSEALVESMETAMGITGPAILLTAVIFEAQGNLNLFHGLCVFNLVSLVGFTVQPKSKKKSTSRRHQLEVVLYYASFLAFLGFSIHLFTTAPMFGNSPECNDTVVLVLLGINFPATEIVLRWILAALLMGLFLAVVVAFFFKPDFYGSTEGPNLPVAVEELAARAYLISNLELTIRNNQLGTGTGDWTFGQIMSMVLLVGPLVEFIAGLRSKKTAECAAPQSEPAPLDNASSDHKSSNGSPETPTTQQSYPWHKWDTDKWTKFCMVSFISCICCI
jgi:hypothetical protein